MSTRSSMIATLLLAGLMTVSRGVAQKSDQAEVELQAAAHKQLVEGQLEEAIKLYKSILARYGNNRPVAAKALVGMGQCYEKLGNTEARKAYERVLREYGDQSEQAAQARTRLAALAKPADAGNATTMTTRRVWAGSDVDLEGAPSPDGHWLTFVDWETGDLAVRDLLTGQKRRLTKKGSWSESGEFAGSSVVSPDGKQVAYNWFNKENFNDLRILPLDGSPENTKPRIIYRDEATGYVQPFDWSPDGKQILCGLARKDRTGQIAFVSVADGSVRAVKTWPVTLGVGVDKMSISPDGRYIVWDYPSKKGLPERDIFLLAADGSRDITLVEHPANDSYPLWTPDGTRVVFASDRTGTMDLWAIRVNDGQPQGNPELIKRDIGRAQPIGLNRKGSLYFGLITGIQDVYIAALDPATGKVVSPPVAGSHRYVGSNRSPDWSPDGEYLAYTSQRGLLPSGQGSRIIAIRSLRTGEERQVSHRVDNNLQRPTWSPDGRLFVTDGWDSKGGWGIFQVDAQTGETTPIVQTEPGAFANFPNWSPDGKAILYRLGDQKLTRLLWRDLETGGEREIYRMARPGGVNGLAVSPDGRRLAFSVSDPATRSSVLMLIPASGGEARELIRLKEPESIWFSSLAWTPDGRQVFFVKGDELWRVPVEGGAAQKIELGVRKPRGIRFHPDGSRIAFWAGENTREVWVMENFLPALAAAQASGITIRQVWDNAIDIFGTPSADGRYLSFADWSTGDLAIRDLKTGENRRLTKKGSWAIPAEAEVSVMSPDGKLAAFLWQHFGEKDPHYEIRVIGTDGTGERVLFQDKKAGFMAPHAWSPDGKSVVAWVTYGTEMTSPNQITLISVADGSARALRTLEGRWPRKITFSPDGRYLAYSRPPEIGVGSQDIYLLDLQASPVSASETRLVEHVADDQMMGWSPDGNYILFQSDRNGAGGAWLLPMRGGKPSGPPQLVKPDLATGASQVVPMAFTSGGSFYYGMRYRLADAQVAVLDPATGRLTGSPAPLTNRFSGATGGAQWSPDGGRVLYRGPNLTIYIRSLETGEERQLLPQLAQTLIAGWHPDGQSLVVTGFSKDKRAGVYRVDLTTGAASPLLESPGGPPTYALMSPDGKTLYYVPGYWKVMARNIATGDEKIVYQIAGYTGVLNLALSRDGRYLAIGHPDKLMIVSTAGGDVRERVITGGAAAKKFFGVDWTPDGKYLLAMYSADDGKNVELWRLPVAEGEPEKTKITPADFFTRGMHVHPDGRRIAFTSAHQRWEVWVMENFLPKLSVSR